MNISRRSFLAISMSSCAGVSLSRTGLKARQSVQPATGVVAPVRAGVSTFVARGGTIGFLVSSSSAVVVDTQFPDAGALLLATLRDRFKDPKVEAVVNTHHHSDHTSGNRAFSGAAKVVVGHVGVAPLMQQAAQRAADAARAAGRDRPLDPAAPTTTFRSTWRTSAGDESVVASYRGACHSGSDSIVLFEKANVYHLGDLVFNRRHPVIDRASGGSLVMWSKALSQLLTEASRDTLFIFGHAGPEQSVTGTLADVARMREYLEVLIGFTHAAKAAGKTRGAFMSLGQTLRGFEGYGGLDPTLLAAAFDELA